MPIMILYVNFNQNAGHFGFEKFQVVVCPLFIKFSKAHNAGVSVYKSLTVVKNKIMYIFQQHCTAEISIIINSLQDVMYVIM